MNIFEQRLEQLKAQQGQVKAPAHHFQERALEFIEEFKVDAQFKGSVFGWFRRRPDKAEAAYRNMQGKKFNQPALYFFKLMGLK